MLYRTCHHVVITGLFLIACIGYSVHSNAQEALQEKVNKEYEEEKLNYILTNLSDRHKVDIRYNESLLPDGKFTYSFNGVTMEDVLKILLNDKGLHFKEYREDRIIVVPAEFVDVDSTLSTIPQEVDESQLDTLYVGSESNPLSEDQMATIQGFLLDSRSFSPIPSALVLNQSTGDYYSSDDQGRFEMKANPGSYILRITSVGHDLKNVYLKVDGSDQLEIELDVKSHLIEEIVISAKSDRQKADQTIVGLEELSRTEIKQLSSFMGEADVVKSVLTLAGVSNIGEGASGFNVRGGSIDQNLILQDGAIIFNPSHVLGFFSSFNPDIVRNTTLSKGHLPSYYGSRVSSVLDVKTKDASNQLTSVKGAIGLISGKLCLETPLIKDKTGLIISTRRSYAGWMLSFVKNADVKNSQARFDDVYAKVTHNFSERTKLNISFFQSFDRFEFADEFGYSWQNRIGNIELRHIHSENLSFALHGAKGRLKNSQFQPEGFLAFDLTSGLNYHQAGTSALWTPSNHEVRIGMQVIDYQLLREEIMPINNSGTRSQSLPKERAMEIGVYLNDQWNVTERLSLNAGLRYSVYRQRGPYFLNLYETPQFLLEETLISQDFIESGKVSDYSGIEPRFGLRYKITDRMSFRASINWINQYIQLLSNTATPTPVDIWQLSTPYIEPVRGRNLAAGISQSSNNVDYTVDVYYKKTDNIIDFRDFAKLLLQPAIESQILSADGRSYGAEFSIHKKQGNVTGRLSYAYTRSELRTKPGQASSINNNDWYFSAYDQPHSFKLFFNWQITKLTRFNMNFTYYTGRPITAPVNNYLVQGVVVPNFSERNTFRVPDYHRLDISYTVNTNRRSTARFKSDLTFTLYNFYARQNVFSIFFRPKTGSVVNARRLSVVGTIIPSVSYNFQF